MNIKSMLKKIVPKSVIRFISNSMNGNYNYFLWLFPIKENKIVFCNYFGNGFGDNGKYVVNKLVEENIECDIVWLIKKNLMNGNELPKNVRYVKYGSLKALYEMATAKLWLDNCRKLFYPPKRKKQYYIQTWHGGIALKQVEKDAESNLSADYVNSAINDSKMANLFISNSRFCTEMYQSAFWYNGDVLECGSPRCDILMNNNEKIIEKVRRYFDFEENSYILIYAPTFRNNESTNIYNINFNQLIKTLEKKFGGVWNILVRMHPNISSKDNFMEYNSKVKNATNYDDMYELLAASDILITDYSSSMFEFSFTNKPVILYTPDIEAYTLERNFYFDIKSLPYPLAEDNNNLSNVIENFDLNVYLKNLKDFLGKLGVKENGHASYEVVKRIKKVIQNK